MGDTPLSARPRPKNTAERIRELLFQAVLDAGCYLWDVEYVKEGTEMTLRVVIDSNEGITVEDCERVSDVVNPILDEADPIESSYRLEVTSPGVERPLTRPEHFTACIGDMVEVKLFAPIHGEKILRGTLAAAEDRAFTLTLSDGTSVTIQKNAAAKVSTVFEW